MKNVTEEELSDAFSEQAQALAEAGADAIVIETMMDLAEIKLALAAAKATGLPVVACMVYDAGKNKDRTMMGVSCEQAARELADAGADVIGANCGIGIEAYVAKKPASRKEVGVIAQRIVKSGKLANYGTPAAQEYLKKWARQFAGGR